MTEEQNRLMEMKLPESEETVLFALWECGGKAGFYQMQQQLARIAKSYPAIPVIVPDGIYGNKTREAVEKFQSVFGLPVTGIVDYNTWYEISNIYVAVTRIAELM